MHKCILILTSLLHQPKVSSTVLCSLMYYAQPLTKIVLNRLVLEGPLFQHYFEKVEVSNFEVASDAFSTCKVLNTSFSCDVSPCLQLFTSLLSKAA